MLKATLAIWDSAMQAYNLPITVPTIQMAIRSFADEVNRTDPSNHLNAHPDDYELHHLANWDEQTGHYEQLKPTCVARAKDHYYAKGQS